MSFKLYPRVIGKHEFGGMVDVTDPCYDKDVWCRINLDMKPDEYSCIVWHTSNNKVGAIGIYAGGVIPPETELKEAGLIGVDAGLAGFFNNKQNFSNEEWKVFCDKLGKDEDAWIDYDGFFSVSGEGDGCYRVLGMKDKLGKYIVAEIRFL